MPGKKRYKITVKKGDKTRVVTVRAKSREQAQAAAKKRVATLG